VLIAANAYPRYFPLLTTAAGTAKPANVLIDPADVIFADMFELP
jgi:NAD(P) transhydrogenase subunit alpha